jgi:hypothetical protein
MHSDGLGRFGPEEGMEESMSDTITAPVVETTDSPAVKRLNLNLAPQAYDDLSSLSRTTNRSMTEIVRLGLGLMKLAFEEQARHNRLVVTDATLKPLREIVLPL